MKCRYEKNRLVFEGDKIPEDGIYVFARKNTNVFGLFTQEQFSAFSERLKETDNERVKFMKRYIFGSAIEVKVENGSFLLSPAFELAEVLKAKETEEYIEIICE